MNREIKFRAWHIKDQQMWQWELLDGNHNRGNGYIGMRPMGKTKNTIHDHRGNMTLVDPMECEIMQFTGLKDKNGKDIYDGDILKFKDGRIAKVRWYETGWYIAGKAHSKMEKSYSRMNEPDEISEWLQSASSYGKLKHSEIIGNIYENPELLKS